MKHLMGLFIKANRIDQAAAALTAYMAAGRSCELLCVTWEKLLWNSVYQLTSASWAQTKVSKHKFTTFHCDANSLEMDWYFIIGAYCLVGAGKFS
jgi:hypothetical protein